MAKELKKLSEKEIQQRLYGEKPMPKAAEKPPAAKPLEKPPQETASGSEVKIIRSFAVGIVFVLLIGFLVTRQPSVSIPKAAPAVNRPYTIQVMVHGSKEGAAQSVGSLKKRGFPAYIKQSATVSGKPQFRIYVGEFATQEEAKTTLTMVKTQPSCQESFIRKK